MISDVNPKILAFAGRKCSVSFTSHEFDCAGVAYSGAGHLISSASSATRFLSSQVCPYIACARPALHPAQAGFSETAVTHSSDHSRSLAALGWSAFFDDQLDPAETAFARMRVATVHRARMTAESVSGPVRLKLPVHANTADHAVGDWVLVEPETWMLVRRLARKTLLQRRTEGGRVPQLIAANLDTLFIVTSCNDDLNVARLERYLALANEAGTTPVIVLTKADQVADAGPYREQVTGLQRGLDVVTLNARSPDAALALAPWCGTGQTVALVGSSGVGKSSLLNTLAAKVPEEAQLTGSIREADSKGRHTTTSRSLHAIAGGGWVIDTPGIRTLHVSDITAGLDLLFAEITELAPRCRFGNCTHSHEPGCAVLAAVAAGTLDQVRVDRWRKLQEENRNNTPLQSGPRGNKTTKAPGRRR
ncbi:ribosome small subunit-dependent GTPase A [Paracoccus sp. MC1854]|nr:ribosome small subunit-dependent GTPase A [Paracoccus sp. MC1854]